VMLHDGRLRVLIKANGTSNSDELTLSEEPTMLHWVPEKK
jgi:hypothetical protein